MIVRMGKINATIVPFSVLLFVALPSFASGSDEELRDTALLLGHESMTLFYNLLGEPVDPGSGQDQPTIVLRARIADYIDRLGLTGVGYPENPVGNSEDATELASYGQAVVDWLGEEQSSAFMVGWYGTIATWTKNNMPYSNADFAGDIICSQAETAGYSDARSCPGDPVEYFLSLLNSVER